MKLAILHGTTVWSGIEDLSDVYLLPCLLIIRHSEGANVFRWFFPCKLWPVNHKGQERTEQVIIYCTKIHRRVGINTKSEKN